MSDDLIISVVVCTYNRSDVLGLCLDSLANQTLDKTKYEVIIIDNNSTDNTQKIIGNYVGNKLNFSSFIEYNQGLSHSRNRGYKVANGEYIAYIDDDAIAENNWLEEMDKFIKAHPKVTAFGGSYIGYTSKPLPWWLPNNYGTKNLGKEIRELQLGKEWLSGTNMIFQKTILKQYNGFPISIGMTGNKISYGEETKFQNELYKNKISIWYTPEIKVKHLTSDQKFAFTWIFKSGYRAGKVHETIFDQKHNLFYYLLLFCFHKIKYGIRLLDFKRFGTHFYRFCHTLSYDVGIMIKKLKL